MGDDSFAACHLHQVLKSDDDDDVDVDDDGGDGQMHCTRCTTLGLASIDNSSSLQSGEQVTF